MNERRAYVLRGAETPEVFADPRYRRSPEMMEAWRHLEGERHSEARMGGYVIRSRAALGLRGEILDVAFWTRILRQDRVADGMGQPPAPDGWGKGHCEFTWSWTVYDGTDSESCGSSQVVATDIESEQQRCAEHLFEVLEQQNPYSRRQSPLKVALA